MRFFTFILSALICMMCIQSQNVLAQSNRPHRCNSDHQMQGIYDQNPDYRQKIEEGRKAVMQKIQSNPNFNSRVGDIITLPVHVIIVHPTGEAVGQGSNLSVSKIESQITALNEDFRRTNADAINTPSVFPVSDAEIEFCLASVDPNGNATNGITRYASNQNFDNNESSIKSTTGWDRDDYLNIWVAPTVGALGYAYVPSTSSLPNATVDGVVIVTTTFGGPNTGSNAPYDLGRTTTHEVGHYLGLDHIWGGGCNQDDGIADTPQQASDNGGCPNHPSPSCNNGGDMFMNYMDYVNDNCMNAFSAGQNTYMRAILNSSRSSLLTSANTKCNLIITPPTCTDGIQNGNETGVDCGGSDCPACEVAPTCTDGVQNGNETGVDCGGSDCPACEVAATCNDGIQNGDETGIDCGGTDCPACETETTCTAPTNITIFGVDENSATVSWNAVSNALSYNLQYKSANAIDWTNASSTGTSLSIGNLESCTQYQIRIQSVCADGGTSKLAYVETTIEETQNEENTTANNSTQTIAKQQGGEAPFEEGELLIQLQPKVPLTQFLKDFQSYKGKSTGLKLKKVVSKSLDIYLFEFNSKKAKHADFASEIFHNKNVRIVQNNHKVTLRNTPNDSQFNQQWQYINTGQSGGTVGADIDADLAWDITTGGTNTDGDEIVVCVIDDGLDENHPDFGDNVWVNTNEIPNNGIDDDNNGYVDDYKGWNTYQSNDNLNDPGHWHGTPVAGIIGAKGNNGTGVSGVNWNVKIMFVVGGGNEAEAIAAYTYPLEMRKLYNETNGQKGAFVVSTNASWGIDGGKAADAPLWCDMYNQLGEQGILSAGATANANTNVDVDGDLPTQCGSDYLFSVTNMNHNDQKVTQAGYGATSIDLGAFGQDAYNVAINNSYEGFGGTSGATPHVAGTIALLYSAPCSNFTALSKSNPGAAALAVRNYILNGTDSNASLQGITTSGGRLNMHKALQELMTANCSGAAPTCTDGIQNGGETGVDCGGNCAPCEVTATCTDGIQNGNETGVDCGGDCSPCGGGETVTSNYSAPISFTTAGCVTCTDGIQNGNETGIDCGGDCSPCDGGNDDYCSGSGQDTEYEWIETVSFGGINNTSGANNGYGDFTSQSTSVEQGSTYPIVLTPGFSSGAYDEYFQVWIDFNGDGDFDDAGELAFDAGNTSTSAVNGSIAIPTNATTGSTRMRVAMRWNEAPNGPCGVFGFGEVEDYTVNITAAPTCTDGVQNGDETGVDCGGSCAPCDDGNDNEYCDSYGDDSSFEFIA
ncbi:MAG: S8 family serine peptidase, partial [Chitinophagales bacterium]